LEFSSPATIVDEAVNLDLPRESESINPRHVNWDLVRSSTFLIHQHFRYEYPTSIRELRHRLIVFPPEVFGDQRRTLYDLKVSQPGQVFTRIDSFANTIVDIEIPVVQGVIEFEARISVERSKAASPRLVPASWLEDSRLLTPTERTMPDRALALAAAELAKQGTQGLELAELANAWAHRAISYGFGVTEVHTTAAQALAGGSGVCQDYAHIMVAICRLLGLPTLYVSGHLLGEGGTHAWVEVLLPASDGSGRAEAWPFDPTHGRRAGLTYVSVAVGLDYGDVAPTSGSYRARSRGSLSSHKRVHLTEVAYLD
jgi:transglutaminase-like putative cysteine protease